MKALNTSLARNQTLKAKIEAQVLAHRHSYAYSPFGKWSIILGSRLLSLQWDTECKKKALVDLEAVLSQSGQGSTYKGAKPIETTELIVDSDPVG